MKLGLREWWSAKSGGDKLVWVIAVLSILLFLAGAFNGGEVRRE